MVNFFYIFLLLSVYLNSVEIDARIESDKAYPNTPLRGSILIQHDGKLKIDETSFSLDKKPLKVERLKQEIIDKEQNIVITLFNFTIPAQVAGNYTLSPISVLIGGKKYSSKPSLYFLEEVRNLKENPKEPFILKLIEVIDAPDTIYPGQIITLGVTYVFNINVQLTKEVLPFLNVSQFEKFGTKQSSEIQKGAFTYYTVWQKYRVIAPGSFTIEGAMIEGFPYENKNIGTNLLRATTRPITINVKPFPLLNRPSYFQGALGTFTVKAALSKNNVAINEPFIVTLTYTGQGDQETLMLQNLLCQPQISGQFTEEKKPIVRKLNDSIEVDYTVSAKNSFIKAFPSLYFASFDPSTHSYIRRETEPISLNVKAQNPFKENVPLSTSYTLSLPPIDLEGLSSCRELIDNVNQATTFEEREKALNKLLNCVKQDKDKAILYKTLNQPQYALYHLKKQLQLTPRDKHIRNEIAALEKELLIESNKKLLTIFPLTQREHLYLLCIVFLLLLLSLILHRTSLFYLFFILISSLLISFGYHRYMAPMEAVVIRASLLEKKPTPSFNLRSADQIIVKRGETVAITDGATNGYVKVSIDNQASGYIKLNHLLLL